MFRFLPYLKKYRIYVILGPIFKLIEAVFELIVPIVTSLIIDKGVRQGDLTYVWHMGGVLIGLGWSGQRTDLSKIRLHRFVGLWHCGT